MNWLNEFLNKQPKNTNEYSYLDKIRQDFEKTYNSTENNNFSEVVKNSKKLYNKNNPYGHTEKFVELDEKTKEEAHRVIYHVAVEMGRKGKLYGSASDINGNTYDFEIFSDTTYRVTEVEFSDNFKEEINEKYNNSDNRYSVRGSIDEQSDYDFNISTDRNGRRSNENVEVSSREQGQQGDNGYRLFDTQQEENNTIKNSKELDNSSFSLDKLPKVKNGYTRLYRGLNEEYNPNYDRSILDSPNGYDTLTDNYELAKQYGKNVYYIDIPTNQLADSVKIGKENYKNNLGELISNTTKIYSDFTQKELNDIILPEIAKENPRYENIKNELNNINSRDFLNKLDKGIYDYEINDYTKKYENKTSYYEDTMDYEQEKHKGRLSKELDNSSFSYDNQGREL